MNVKRSIRRKRMGESLSAREIEELISGFSAGEVPDYQMTALLMAILWRGMSDDETLALTRAMIASGRTRSWDVEPTADKHSTGGVGDKVSLVLAPLAASAGIYVPMLSGRGLGHTGGTVDKLESVPGFTARLDGERFAHVLREVGCVMGGQSGDLAPADGRLYALRDATETVESLPLIVSSILSKKVAAGPRALVLDVKVGRGAFVRSLDGARELAHLLVATGTELGLDVLAFLTDMDVPLGRAIGNAIEANEAADVLAGREVSSDLVELTLLLTSAMAVLTRLEPDLASARRTLTDLLQSGAARERYERMVSAQGGDPGAAIGGELPLARAVPVPSFESGIVADVDPLTIAGVVTDLGGGRRRVTDDVDHSVGIWLDRRPGESVKAGEPLATLHVRDCAGDPSVWVERVRAAYSLGERRSAPLVHAIVGAGGESEWTGWTTRLPIS